VVVRERHVMLDEDLAVLYGVQTGRLIEQVKRNIDRFPSDFMFPLRRYEAAVLRSQSAISSDRHGGRRYAPYVFTEQGVAMLSGVLRSKTAVAVNYGSSHSIEGIQVADLIAGVRRRSAEGWGPGSHGVPSFLPVREGALTTTSSEPTASHSYWAPIPRLRLGSKRFEVGREAFECSHAS
jgi:hypothetical protein